MRRTLLNLRAIAVLIAVGVAVGACAQATPETSAQPTTRTLYMAAIEPKGSTTVDKEPFPEAALPAGNGYILKAPDPEGRWEVSSYRWSPGTLVVHQGDDVTLEIVGINGAEHPSVIEGYDVNFTVQRGQVSQVSFQADKAGIFNIIYHAHQPSMIGQLIVSRERSSRRAPANG